MANYRNFVKLSTREGSEVDVQNCRVLFQQMGYTIVCDITDATRTETLKSLVQFRDDTILQKVDSLIVILMSHGCERNIFYTSDEEMVLCDEVIDTFTTSVCPALYGKPKVFIFQMCRGTEEHIPRGVSTDGAPFFSKQTGMKPERKHRRKISDVFICYSSLPGFASYRHPDHGSHFIHYLCKIFMHHAKDFPLNTLVKMVNREAPKPIACEMRELATTREFYFNPIGMDEKQPLSAFNCLIRVVDEKKQRVSPVTHRRCSVDNTEEVEYIKTIHKIESEKSSPMISTTRRRGSTLIINNLPGCQEDMMTLADIFSGMDYVVHGPHFHLTRQQLFQTVHEFRKVSQESSAVSIILYGNGLNDSIVSSDGLTVYHQELLRAFNDTNCPYLAGRPKIFVFKSCRSTETNYVEESVCKAVQDADDNRRGKGYEIFHTRPFKSDSPTVKVKGGLYPSLQSLNSTESLELLTSLMGRERLSACEPDEDGDLCEEEVVMVCRANQYGNLSEERVREGTSAYQIEDIPVERDMFVFNVEVDGRCERGSLLTQAMAHSFQAGGRHLEITSLMRLVSRRLQELQSPQRVSEHAESLTKTSEHTDRYFTEMRCINFNYDFHFSVKK